MKQVISISLLILYLNSFTEFHELLRLRILVEHFQEHKIKVNDITFWDFLVMHYQTDASHDDQDNELPFKDKNHSCAPPAITLPFQKLVLRESLVAQDIEHISYYKVAYFSSPNQAIFQPPKVK